MKIHFHLSFKVLSFIVIILLFSSCMEKKQKTAPVNLTCELTKIPLGIDNPFPRLSWQMNDTSRGAAQTAYQILVASSAGLLNNDKVDCWDSGIVEGSISHAVKYKGQKLVSGKRYYWKVKIWDESGKVSAYSEPAWWEMGLLNPADWQAHWITTDEAGMTGSYIKQGEKEKYVPPRSLALRKKFKTAGTIRRARVYVTGLGSYVLFINGKRVGNDLLTPGWTNYPDKIQYQTYDVTGLLQPEKNAIGAWLGNMWWSSGLGWSGAAVYSNGPLCLLAQLEIEYMDGKQQVITSDNTWKVSTSPLIYNSLYDGETYNANFEEPGWNKPGFVDAAWHNAVETDSTTARLVAQQGPPIRVTDTLSPVNITEPIRGIYIADFGQNIAGRAQITIKGKKGDSIILRYAELLHDDGTVAQENLRSAKATDIYICKNDTPVTWHPHFTYHGFRYVQIEGLTKAPDNQSLKAQVFHSDAPVTGYFHCADTLINRIWKNIFRGQKANMMSVPTDCPQRDERLGWMGDAQIFAPTASYNMNMDRFFAKWEKDIIDSQDSSGYVYDVNPAIVVDGPAKPGWGDAVVIIPWEMYRFYGDTKIIRDNYAGMKAWVEYMRRNSKDGLYWWQQGDWYGYGDWVAPVASPGKPVGSAYYYRSVSLLGKMASIIGEMEDADTYDSLAGDIANAFNSEYFNSQTKSYFKDTQTANLLPVAFGITPTALRQAVIDQVAKDVMNRDTHLSTGFLGTASLLPMLSEYGYHNLAYQLAIQDTYPSWGYMIKNGATSMWELWNSNTEPPDQMNSRNHFALGGVGEWFYEYLAGIRPIDSVPGFKKILIAPLIPDKLDNARATLKTWYGTVMSEWVKLPPGGLVMNVSIPANSSAIVEIPVEKGSSPLIRESNRICMNREGQGLSLPHIRFAGRKTNAVVYDVDAGEYSFRIEK